MPEQNEARAGGWETHTSGITDEARNGRNETRGLGGHAKKQRRRRRRRIGRRKTKSDVFRVWFPN